MKISCVNDFEVSGDGSASAWQSVPWEPLVRVGEGKASHASRTKILWSQTGLYFLVDCEDRQLTCTMTQDGDDLFREDVVEVFLWPDEAHPVYFEYEISPLNFELPILVSNHEGTFHGWLPWHYIGPRRVRHATSVRGGTREPGAAVTGWSAEFFIPFELFSGLGNTPPKAGSRWRANIYRLDYDAGEASHWAWNPETAHRFHNYQQFGVLEFV